MEGGVLASPSNIINNMKYIYTSDSCHKCIALKEKYNRDSIEYQERDAQYIKSPQDHIDVEALIQASMQNMELPVEIEI